MWMNMNAELPILTLFSEHKQEQLWVTGQDTWQHSSICYLFIYYCSVALSLSCCYVSWSNHSNQWCYFNKQLWKVTHTVALVISSVSFSCYWKKYIFIHLIYHILIHIFKDYCLAFSPLFDSLTVEGQTGNTDRERVWHATKVTS